MKMYLGFVTEILQRKTLIEAENETDAYNLLAGLYRNEHVVLGAEDLVDSDLEIKELQDVGSLQAHLAH